MTNTVCEKCPWAFPNWTCVISRIPELLWTGEIPNSLLLFVSIVRITITYWSKSLLARDECISVVTIDQTFYGDNSTCESHHSINNRFKIVLIQSIDRLLPVTSYYPSLNIHSIPVTVSGEWSKESIKSSLFYLAGVRSRKKPR